jgi:2-polyprenyl-6-methoxyphenol hydroxylase-like FAD-dependent oxidoreductase
MRAHAEIQHPCAPISTGPGQLQLHRLVNHKGQRQRICRAESRGPHRETQPALHRTTSLPQRQVRQDGQSSYNAFYQITSSHIKSRQITSKSHKVTSTSTSTSHQHQEYDADDSIRTRIARSLERGIGRLAGGTKPVAPVITSIPTALANFPLRLSHADSYFHDRAVLIGYEDAAFPPRTASLLTTSLGCRDAGHTVHPLAGQGANMGFSDVQVLAEEILRAAENGTDVGKTGAHASPVC